MAFESFQDKGFFFLGFFFGGGVGVICGFVWVFFN